MKTVIAELNKIASNYQSKYSTHLERGNTQQADFLTKKIDEILAASEILEILDNLKDPDGNEMSLDECYICIVKK